MNAPAADSAETLFLLADTQRRIHPIVRETFAPPIETAPDYLRGIAAVVRTGARGVLVAIDPLCRRIDSALHALKRVAAPARVVLCCAPSDEPLCRRLVADRAADDYVVLPPTPDALARALALPRRIEENRWARSSLDDGAPSHEELARLADLLPALGESRRAALRGMAQLVALALRAESALVLADGLDGAVGPRARHLLEAATLVQTIPRGTRPGGQIRLGRSLRGAYDAADMRKLNTYALLFGRMLDAAERTRLWHELAVHDDLTGLLNRRGLMTWLDERLDLARRNQMEITLLLFDLDDFKEYNDRFGHDVGDQILRETAELLRRCCRRHDLVARYAGDEFVVVFWDPAGPRISGSQHPQEVLGVLNRFRAALREHAFQHLGPQSRGCLTCSGGLARFPQQADNPADLIKRADEALYEAKRAGKNRFWLVGSGDVCPDAPPDATGPTGSAVPHDARN